MSFWFAYRVSDRKIDIEPRPAILAGPFDTYEEAVAKNRTHRGPDMEKTGIFDVGSKKEAEERLFKEGWKIQRWN